ncbi:hypothetical protein PM082_017175 [Marasmius tenuissimus]|nr:hypothetical protein PM082_017175 [Marasmius tenuissimus]
MIYEPKRKILPWSNIIHVCQRWLQEYGDGEIDRDVVQHSVADDTAEAKRMANGNRDNDSEGRAIVEGLLAKFSRCSTGSFHLDLSPGVDNDDDIWKSYSSGLKLVQ